MNDGASARPSTRPQARAALLAMVALVVFIATALWTQWVRQDLDWVQATLSLYLHGPWGLALRCAYGALALAIMLLAYALHVDSRSPRRSGAAPGLFWAGALGLLGVAIGDSLLPQRAPLLAPLVHGLAANTAFLCVSVAMLLQSWYLRADPRWSRWAGRAWAWAWLCFVLLWLHVLWRGPPRGAGQKLVIAVLVLWLLAVAGRQWRTTREAGVATPG